MTNNAAERAIRPLVLGRKNYLFAGSDSGGHRAAAMYTIIETCKMNRLNPPICATCSPASPTIRAPALELEAARLTHRAAPASSLPPNATSPVHRLIDLPINEPNFLRTRTRCQAPFAERLLPIQSVNAFSTSILRCIFRDSWLPQFIWSSREAQGDSSAGKCP